MTFRLALTIYELRSLASPSAVGSTAAAIITAGVVVAATIAIHTSETRGKPPPRCPLATRETPVAAATRHKAAAAVVALASGTGSFDTLSSGTVAVVSPAHGTPPPTPRSLTLAQSQNEAGMQHQQQQQQCRGAFVQGPWGRSNFPESGEGRSTVTRRRRMCKCRHVTPATTMCGMEQRGKSCLQPAAWVCQSNPIAQVPEAAPSTTWVVPQGQALISRGRG